MGLSFVGMKGGRTSAKQGPRVRPEIQVCPVTSVRFSVVRSCDELQWKQLVNIYGLASKDTCGNVI